MMVDIVSANDNFSMKFNTRGRSSWPLPPSSVFKCRTAKPWIDPDLFQVNRYAIPGSSSMGVIMMGDFLENSQHVTHEQQKCYTINEEIEENIYSEPVEVFGLPLPNSKIKVIEYSNNPEKGIDPGDDDGMMSTTSSADSVVKQRLYNDGSFSGESGMDSSNPLFNSNEKGSLKRKFWIPFKKTKARPLKQLFY